MLSFGSFLKSYFKKYGVVAAVLSFVCLVLFFVVIIPTDAVTIQGSYDYTGKYIGGVQSDASEKNVAYDANTPRNADGERLQYVGTFKVTHYCACTICTWGSGITASGKPVADGMIASDWKVLPKGTKVYIKRGDTVLEKIVEDTGGAIQGNRIDIYVPSHSQALQLGVYTTDLYVDPNTELP